MEANTMLLQAYYRSYLRILWVPYFTAVAHKLLSRMDVCWIWAGISSTLSVAGLRGLLQFPFLVHVLANNL